MRDIIGAPAGWLARAIRTKQVSSLEVVRAHLEHIHTVNPRLNAVVFATGESALKQARAADRKNSGESRARPPARRAVHGQGHLRHRGRRHHGRACACFASNIPDRDATVVARMRAAGAILIGKTQLPAGRRRRRQLELAARRHSQPVRHRPLAGREQQRRGGDHRRRRLAGRPRQRLGRQHPAAGPLLRHRRPQAHDGPASRAPARTRCPAA